MVRVWRCCRCADLVILSRCARCPSSPGLQFAWISQWWAADIDIGSIAIPPPSNDPSLVYSKNSAAHARLQQGIDEAVRYIPEGEEEQESYAHVILNCRATPKKVPDEAYRHLYALCVSEVTKMALSLLACIRGSVSAGRS